MMRVNKFLATNTALSRRQADEAIAAGRVRINGELAVIGSTADDASEITLDNTIVSATTPTVVLFNKPRGYVCSRKQQGSSPTIYDILPEKYRSLKTAGRLDADSSGLIILTNDGDLAHSLMHPSHHKQKVYLVTLDRDLEPLHQQMIADFGIDLDDGHSKLGLMRLNDSSRREWQVTMSEGRNRQIRRTFAALGYTVTKLHRTQFGAYSLGDIKPGQTSEC